MKLTDISATTGSRAATAKLARQVQKTGVAAGKEARTNLGVLGISIGQTQSTGITSRVSEAVSGQSAWDLMEALGEHINYPLSIRPTSIGAKDKVAFNRVDAANAALQMTYMWSNGGDTKKTNECTHAFSMVRNRLPGANDLLVKITEQEVALRKAGFKNFPALQQVFDAARLLQAFDQETLGTLAMTEEILDWLDGVWDIAFDQDHKDKARATFAKAGLKQLGIVKK